MLQAFSRVPLHCALLVACGGASGEATILAAHGGKGAAAGTAGHATAGASATPSFVTRTLSTDYYAEGAAVGDINGDSVLDLVAGPNWYAGPRFELTGTLVADPPKLTMDQYGAFFLTFVDDVNGDGRADVIAVADAGGGNGSGTPNTHWYENPGPSGLGQAWTKHAMFAGLVSNESPTYLDAVGDAKRELVFMTQDQLGYAKPGDTPTQPWNFTAISGDATFGAPYVHGLGVGDIDGDGLFDLVERSGWWRQVADAPWQRHAFEFWLDSTQARAGNWGGAQMAVYDIDGDADADVVTALAAHQYGLGWFEQQGSGAMATFVPHEILPTAPAPDNVSQLHAMAVADINGDGLLDIVTGKRYYAHPSTTPDPGTTDPALVVWFELRRRTAGAEFVRHVIHSDSGVGCNFVARDVTGDGKVDVFTTNKHGTFLHVQQ